MKVIGLIGGMSWESTVFYYRQINELVKARLGGLHSAHLVMYSVDFHGIERLQRAGQWEEAGAILARAAQSLEAAGAELVVLCTNTMHKVAAAIEGAARIPFLHIADATADAVKATGVRTVGLLGTRFTMEEDFYRGRLQERHGIEVITPDGSDAEAVHRIIYDELCLGAIREESRREYQAIMRRLADRGAGGIILGCTEIGMLVSQADAPVPLFDTTKIHATRAVDAALAPG